MIAGPGHRSWLGMCVWTAILSLTQANVDAVGSRIVARSVSGNVTLATEHRINCGGPAFVDTNGGAWASDDYFALPSKAQRDPDSDVVQQYNGSGLSEADSHLLYSRRRFAPRAARSVAYVLPVRRAGQYVVQLHFAEFTARAAEPGGRVLDVVIQGISLGTLDLGATVGLRQVLIESYNAEVIDNQGAVQIELLGVTRAPFISAIEVLGPSTSIPTFTRMEAAVVPVFEPPRDKETINALASLFHLTHVATGTRHRNDVMFSSAAAPDYYMFRVDEARDVANLRAFEERCAEQCTFKKKCRGFFVRVLTSSMYCAGVRTIGGYVATNTLTRCWGRDLMTIPDDSTDSAEQYSTALSRRAIEAASGNISQYGVAFEGRTAENAGGPWLSFSTALMRSEYAFGPIDATMRGCADHCTLVPDCQGFVITADPDGQDHMSCVGLRTLGFRRGIETQLSSISYVELRDIQATTGSIPTAPTMPNAIHDSEADGWSDTAGSEGQSSIPYATLGAAVGVVIVLATLVAVARRRYKRRLLIWQQQKIKDENAPDLDWESEFGESTTASSMREGGASSVSPTLANLIEIMVPAAEVEPRPIMTHRLSSRLTRGQTTTAAGKIIAAAEEEESLLEGTRKSRGASRMQSALFRHTTGNTNRFSFGADSEGPRRSRAASRVKSTGVRVSVAGSVMSSKSSSSHKTPAVTPTPPEAPEPSPPRKRLTMFTFGLTESSTDSPEKIADDRVLFLTRSASAGYEDDRDKEA